MGNAKCKTFIFNINYAKSTCIVSALFNLECFESTLVKKVICEAKYRKHSFSSITKHQTVTCDLETTTQDTNLIYEKIASLGRGGGLSVFAEGCSLQLHW